MPTPLELRRLELCYQPVVDLFTREVVALEVLLQRRDPEHGLVAPPAAALDQLDVAGEVLDEACRQASAWERQGLTLGISINASAAQLPGYAPLVRRSLESSGLPASRLTVEVCEPGVVGTATAALRELAGLGSTVALDEFGTGHSSLMDLRRFPVGQLKIDCSYVAGLGRHRDDDAMVSSIVSLGRALGITCVALGVEATGQVEQLLELGCERAQGPLFSQPVPVDHVPAAIDAAEAWAVPARPKPAAAAGRDAVAPVPDGVLLNMQQMHAAGASYATIAASLNQMGSRHPAGRHWHRASVARVLADNVASRSVSA